MSKVSGRAFDYDVFRRLLRYAKDYRKTFNLAFLAAVLLSVLGVLRPVLTQIAIDDYVLTGDMEGLVYMIVLMVAILMFETLAQFSYIYLANWLGQTIIRDIRVKVYDHLLSFKLQYFDKTPIGTLVTRVVSDIERIADVFGQGLLTLLSDILKMVVIAGVMLHTNWQLAVIVFLVMPLLLFATREFQKAIKVAFTDVRNQVAKLNGFVQERLSGMSVIQLFAREQAEYDKFVNINKQHRKAHLKTVLYFSIFFPVAELLSSLALGLVIWYGGLQSASNQSVTIGELIAFISLIQMLFRPMRQLADKFNVLQLGVVSADRVFRILDTDAHIDNSGKLVPERLNGNIVFDKVEFSYLPGEKVLKGIDLEVASGTTVAIVGATGAGKSTIINLLSRFYEIEGGTISIGEHEIHDYDLTALRSRIAVVLQDVFLFSDSIYNNIVLNKDIPLEKVKESARMIGVHDFIMSLPGGYDYNVKERGAMLSVGQRQLLSFLRAYVTEPDILVLDEATSSVDSHTEQLIQDALETLTKGRTSIVIAHRLATIKKADQIVVMDRGQIVEKGTHEELLEIDGLYRNLYEIQFSHYEY